MRGWGRGNLNESKRGMDEGRRGVIVKIRLTRKGSSRV
jgi:hypothetical protein